MVARIISGKNIEGMLRYNETKVSEGKARLLDAVAYPKEADRLSFKDKLSRLTKYTALNSRVRTNAVHISLNFDPSERPDDALLREVAAAYMEGIGFGSQPYLVYRHEDAAHPHVHIVTTNITSDGSRISLHNIGRLRSEPVRVELEQRFGLVVAADGKRLGVPGNKEPERLVYGRHETRGGIAEVVSYVLRHYRFTSIGSLNAALAVYGVTADRGKKGTAMYARGGLQYWIIDRNNGKQGTPVKASALPGRPTLRKLELSFRTHEQQVVLARARIRTAVDHAMVVATRNGCSLAQALQNRQIELFVNVNAEGRVYGLSLVDTKHKIALKGSELGKSYSAHGIMQQLERAGRSKMQQVLNAPVSPSNRYDNPNSLWAIIDPVEQPVSEPPGFKKKRKKKRPKKL